MTSENPAVEPTVNDSESGGKNVICVSTGIVAVAAALMVILVPLIAVTVVPTVTPATSTISPTEMLVFASTAIIVAPTATTALFSTEAPNPSTSTKDTSLPKIAAEVFTSLPDAFFREIELPDTVLTKVSVGMPFPNTWSPTAILVASATKIVFPAGSTEAVV